MFEELDSKETRNIYILKKKLIFEVTNLIFTGKLGGNRHLINTLKF